MRLGVVAPRSARFVGLEPTAVTGNRQLLRHQISRIAVSLAKFNWASVAALPAWRAVFLGLFID